MHASPEIGKLMLTPETPVPDTVIASNILRIGPSEWDKVKAILLEYGVASTCPDTGALMCRRMVRDERNRVKSRAHGKRGGHPAHKAAFLPPPYPYSDKKKRNPLSPPAPPYTQRKEKEERKEEKEKKSPHMPSTVNNSKLSETEKGRLRVLGNSPLMLRVGKLFNRNESTLWTIGEAESLSQISPTNKELATLKNYYSAVFPKDKDYRRRKLQTLLNNWNGEVDIARAWAKEQQKGLSKRLRDATASHLAAWKMKSILLETCQFLMTLVERGNLTISSKSRNCANLRRVWPGDSKHWRHD